VIRRALRWLPPLALAALLGWLWTLLLPPGGRAAGDRELTVVSWNVHGLNYEGEATSPELVFSALKAFGPDVLLLQEMGLGRRGGELAARLGRELGLEHAARFPYGDEAVAGTMILARWPLAGVRELPLPPSGEGRSLGLARVEIDGRGLWVAVAHFANSDIHVFGKRASLLSELGGENLRTVQAEAALAALAPLAGEALVLGGDFNTFPLSAAWRILRRDYRDAFRPPAQFRGTYRVKGDIEVKLDHIFLSAPVEALDAQVLDAPGSDHLPVRARLRF